MPRLSDLPNREITHKQLELIRQLLSEPSKSTIAPRDIPDARRCGLCAGWRRSQTCIAIGLGNCRLGQGDINDMSHESYSCAKFHPAYAPPVVGTASLFAEERP